MPWITGPFMAFSITAIRLPDWLDGSPDFIPWYVFALLNLALFGVGFGFSLPSWARAQVGRELDGLYNGEDWIFERLEGEECFRYRMPAALAIGPKRPVTGVLHLGRPGLFFVPNRKSAAKHRPIEMTPLDRIALCIVDPPPRTLRQKLFIPHPQRLLEFSSGGQSARFEVPLVDYTAERLTGFLSALQADEAES
jgi:hypothetical protein